MFSFFKKTHCGAREVFGILQECLKESPNLADLRPAHFKPRSATCTTVLCVLRTVDVYVLLRHDFCISSLDLEPTNFLDLELVFGL